MIELIASCSKSWISDWVLCDILKLVPDIGHIKFDRARALRDISNNILDNAYMGGGNQLDFAFKQANLGFEEYKILVRMWGEPQRIIFCFREPAGYIASAKKKFNASLKDLQFTYIRLLKDYERIGGDIFEYTPNLNIEDFISFLKPLRLKREFLKDFVHRPDYRHEDASEEMRSAYHGFKKKNKLK